ATSRLSTLSLHDALPISRSFRSRHSSSSSACSPGSSCTWSTGRSRPCSTAWVERRLSISSSGNERGHRTRDGGANDGVSGQDLRSEEHTSELQSLAYLVC